jgi:hypothetical protein
MAVTAASAKGDSLLRMTFHGYLIWNSILPDGYGFLPTSSAIARSVHFGNIFLQGLAY